MKLRESFFDKYIYPLILVVLSLVGTSLVSHIKTGNWLKWFKSIPKVVLIVFFIFILFWFIVIAIRKRINRLREIDSGSQVFPFWEWNKKKTSIEKTNYVDVIWRICAPEPAPLKSFNPLEICASDIKVETPPRCPKCETEIEQSRSFWGGYIWKCVKCGFKKRNSDSFYQEAKRLEKIAQREWEKRIEDRTQKEIDIGKPSSETLQEMESEKGFLDFLKEGEDAVKEISLIIIEYTEETKTISNKFNANTVAIQELTKNPVPEMVDKAYSIALIIGKDMSDYSEKLVKKLPLLDKNIDILNESFSSYITTIKQESEQDKDALKKFRENIAVLFEANKTAQNAVRAYRNAISKLGSMGISKAINRASRQLTQTLNNLVSFMEKLDAFCVRTLKLIDEKLKS